jgi:curved DNA-binding protein CbpA
LLYHPDKQQQDRRPSPFSSLAAAAGGSGSETTVAHGQSTVNLNCSGVAVPSSTVHRGAGLSFELISQAYQVLSNDELRRDYDERRAVRVHAGVNAEDVSINEFDRDDDSCDDDRCYHRQCRCGDLYEVSQATLAHTYYHHTDVMHQLIEMLMIVYTIMPPSVAADYPERSSKRLQLGPVWRLFAVP